MRIQFTNTKIVSGKGFAEVFLGWKGPEDIDPDPETRIRICAVQGAWCAASSMPTHPPKRRRWIGMLET